MDKYLIYSNGNVYTPSEYQIKIFKEIEHGTGNLVIIAAAGSAKTATIENCVRFVKNGKKILFIAFNKSTVEKLKADIKGDKNVMIVTFHSLGLQILKERRIVAENVPVDDNKYAAYIKENILSLGGEETVLGLADRYTYINNCLSLIDYSRYYLAMRDKEIREVAEKYGINLVANEIEVVKKALIWGKSNTSVIDHTDMIWLPNVLNVITRRYLFDFIFIDEAQDSTLARIGLVERCFGRSCRFVAVGDPNQQINVWCGASMEALIRYKNKPNTQVFNLPISYRCPKKIIEMAKPYSPDIKAADNAIDGEIRKDVSEYAPTGSDLVLCRVASPLIDLSLKYLRVNKKFFIIGGGSIKESLLSLIESSNQKYIDLYQETDEGLINYLYRFFEKRKSQLMQEKNLGEDEIFSEPELLELFDKIESIKAASEGLDTVDELEDKLNLIFEGEDREDAVYLSTAHKAKGLEADNVFILKPSLMPSPFVRLNWEREMEQHLYYVSITRAKKTLSTIKEEKKGFFMNFKTKKTKEKEAKDVIKKIENDKNGILTPNDIPKKSSKKAGLKFKNLT